MLPLLFFITVFTHTPTLSWSDFKGKPDPTSEYDAVTSTYWSRIDTVIEGKYYYVLTSGINQEKSWVRSPSETLLRHEQLHALISEYMLKQFQNRIKPYQGGTEKENKKVEKLWIIYNNRLDKLQDLYDRETKHGQVASIQRQWEENVNKEIKKGSVNTEP